MKDTTYNGWKNYETWNVTLWISNDETLYNVALDCSSYEAFVFEMQTTFESQSTPDGVYWDDEKLDFERLEIFMEEL